MIVISVWRYPHAEGLQLPAYKSEDAAGMDLVAALAAEERSFWLPARGR